MSIDSLNYNLCSLDLNKPTSSPAEISLTIENMINIVWTVNYLLPCQVAYSRVAKVYTLTWKQALDLKFCTSPKLLMSLDGLLISGKTFSKYQSNDLHFNFSLQANKILVNVLQW